MTLDTLAALCGAKVSGDGTRVVNRASDVDSATDSDIVYVTDTNHLERLNDSRAGAVILPPQFADRYTGNMLLSDNPKLAFARVAAALHPEDGAEPGIHPAAVIDPSAVIASTATVGPCCVIGPRARIGGQSRLDSGVNLGAGATVGERCRLAANVVIGAGSVVGDDCVLSPGVVIGAAGFGLARDGAQWQAIPQLGRAILGNRVEVGANTTIDRGALRDTVVGDGVKLDNLIQIGHNVEIGENTVIAAHTAVAGSTRIGARCEIGGCVGIMDHSTITDDVKIGGGSVISGTIREPGIYSSSIKADKLSVWQKSVARFRQLDELARRVRNLEKNKDAD